MEAELKALAKVGAEVKAMDLLRELQFIEKRFPGATNNAKKRLQSASLEIARAVGAAKAKNGTRRRVRRAPVAEPAAVQQPATSDT